MDILPVNWTSSTKANYMAALIGIQWPYQNAINRTSSTKANCDSSHWDTVAALMTLYS